MNDAKSLYLKLPVFLQQIACNIEGWRIRRSRFSGNFTRILDETEKRSEWSADQIHAFRDQRLRRFIWHCFETVPFYRDQLKEMDISLEDFQTLDDLKKLPVINKYQVQQSLNKLTSEAVSERDCIMVNTSGTTGGGMLFPATLESIQQFWATVWRYRRLHGIDLDTWSGHFGGQSLVPVSQTSPPFWRYNYPGRQVLFSAFHTTPENLKFYAEELRRRRLPWLHGYPSLITLLASYIIESGFDLGYQVRWITLGAENLLSQQKSQIEKAFGVNPIQHYGLAEAGAIFSECENGNFHVDEDFSAVEFIPDSDGTGCRVVGTNFSNYATPLIRYDLEDNVTLSTNTCSCGHSGRIIENLDGRKEDYIVLKDGARIGRLDHLFKGITNVKEAQIYQGQTGEISIRIVRRDGYCGDDERKLSGEIEKRIGSRADVSIEYMEKLERTQRGKLRFVISDMPEGKIDPEAA